MKLSRQHDNDRTRTHALMVVILLSSLSRERKKGGSIVRDGGSV